MRVGGPSNRTVRSPVTSSLLCFLATRANCTILKPQEWSAKKNPSNKFGHFLFLGICHNKRKVVNTNEVCALCMCVCCLIGIYWETIYPKYIACHTTTVNKHLGERVVFSLWKWKGSQTLEHLGSIQVQPGSNSQVGTRQPCFAVKCVVFPLHHCVSLYPSII